MEGEGDILHHDQAVCHRDTSEEHVDRIGPHILVCQHQDIGQVKNSSQNTNTNSKMSMNCEVGILRVCFVRTSNIQIVSISLVTSK